MTVHVRTLDPRPQEFAVDTPEQAVGYLWKMAFVRESDPGEYMVEVARRVAIYNRHVVRTDSAANFLTDLAAAGFITVDFEEPQ
jgi:hypothetical protein